jgi:hypothetical protein
LLILGLVQKTWTFLFCLSNWPNDPCVGIKEGSSDLVKFGEAKKSP